MASSDLQSEKRRWVEEAMVAGRLIGLNASTVSSAFSIVLNAFGDNWLKAELQRCDPRKYGGLIAGHPLVHALRIGQRPQTSEVVELAEYLTEFHRDPSLPKIIEHMRDQQHFENYRLPLAMGHRWLAAGMRCTLEPDVGNRRADLAVAIGNASWMVECSNQNLSASEDTRSKLRNITFQRVSAAIDSSMIPIALRIVGGIGVNDQQLTAVVRAVRSLAAKLAQDSGRTFVTSVGEWKIELRKLCLLRDPLPKAPDDPAAKAWDLISECKSVPRRFVDYFPKDCGTPIPGIPRSRIYLRINETQRDVEDAILRKIDKKISQTSMKDLPQARWITIGVQENVLELERRRIEDSVLDRLARHARVLGISLCHRRYWRGRHIYDQLVWSNPAHQLPRALLEELLRVEDRIAYWFIAA